MERRRLLLVVAAVVAALGCGLVFVYAQGAEKRAADEYDTTEVLVATQRVEPGESFDDAFKDGKFELAPVTAGLLLDGSSEESDTFRGKVALTTIYPNEQLVDSKFGGADEIEAAATLPLPEGKMAISILVSDDGRVGKFLSPGAEIAVIFTDIDRTTQEPISTTTLLDRVTILAAGNTTSVGTGEADDSPDAQNEGAIQQLLTVAVTQRQAEKVRFAEKDGVLSAALLNDASEVEAQEDAEDGVVKDNLLQ